jgi:ferredoxin
MKRIFITIHRSGEPNHHSHHEFLHEHHDGGYKHHHSGEYPEESPFWLHINESKCIGCGACVKYCHEKVFRLKEITEENSVQQSSYPNRLRAIIENPENCHFCGKCVKICKQGAIQNAPG